MFQEKCRKHYETIYYKCLRKYDQLNKHFSMKIMTTNEEGRKRLIGYKCIYRYATHEVKIEYNISTDKWTIISDENHSKEEKQLNMIITHANDISWIAMGFSLDERVEDILESFDGYFYELDQAKEPKQNKENISKSLSVFKEEEEEFECVDDNLNELSSHKASTSSFKSEDEEEEEDSTSLEKDVDDNDLHSLLPVARQKCSYLTPPPVAPRPIRKNSACSEQSSVRYTSLIPPATAPLRQRRVIESILLYVQQNEKTFEKIVNASKGTKSPMMYELGVEVLRTYDGKFNYPQGHTLVMSFRKKTWFLTIDKINYVDCSLGDTGPRSVLILNYKDQLTCVQV